MVQVHRDNCLPSRAARCCLFRVCHTRGNVCVRHGVGMGGGLRPGFAPFFGKARWRTRWHVAARATSTSRLDHCTRKKGQRSIATDGQEPLIHLPNPGHLHSPTHPHSESPTLPLSPSHLPPSPLSPTHPHPDSITLPHSGSPTLTQLEPQIEVWGARGRGSEGRERQRARELEPEQGLGDQLYQEGFDRDAAALMSGLVGG